MSDIAKEIERLADKYRAQKKAIFINQQANDNAKIEQQDDDFNQEYLSVLEGEISRDDEIKISDFIHPALEVVKKNIEASPDNSRPREEAMFLIRNISRNLRDLKSLIRG